MLVRPGAAGILYHGGPPYQDCILVAYAELGPLAFSVQRRRHDRARRRSRDRRAPAAPPVQAAGASTDAPAGAPTDSPAGGAHGTARGRTGEPPGSAALLLGDATGAFLLANEARYRTLDRTFGIRREDANLATVIGLLLLANAVYERAHRPQAPKPPTAVANLAIGVGALRESIYGVATGLERHAARRHADRGRGPRRSGATARGQIAPRHQSFFAPAEGRVPRSVRTCRDGRARELTTAGFPPEVAPAGPYRVDRFARAFVARPCGF